MALHHSPSIITDGLVLCLDAANRESYSRSGTIWTDLAGINNGTLTNGPTFNSANGGSIVFDGVNDYVLISDSPSLNLSSVNRITISSWFFASSDGTTTTLEIFHKRNNSPTFVSYGISWQLVTTNNNRLFSRLGFTDGSFSDLNSGILNKSQWYHGTQVFDGSIHYMYINGVLVSQSLTLVGKTIKDDNLPVTIGAYNNTVEFFNGRVSFCQIYNRALSPAEVLQNYNATKGRFNL